METNKKLQLQTFVNDTYDVLAGNTEYCSQEEYLYKDMLIMNFMLIVPKTLLLLMIFKLQLH